MSTPVIVERIAEGSPRFKARMAGLFWLMTFLAGSAALFAGGRLVVRGDAAATAANILANESLLRLSVAADLIATACYLAATILVYELLKPVNRSVSLIAAVFSLMGCAAGALSFLFQLAPLVVLVRAPYLSVFTGEQLQALAFTFLRLRDQASTFNFAFFGLHCLLVGFLIFRSTFLPRIVGALMACAGLGWLTLSFASLLAPPLARSLFPWILLPGMLGEVTLSLWLLLMGVNVQRWMEQAGAAGQWPSQRAAVVSGT